MHALPLGRLHSSLDIGVESVRGGPGNVGLAWVVATLNEDFFAPRVWAGDVGCEVDGLGFAWSIAIFFLDWMGRLCCGSSGYWF